MSNKRPDELPVVSSIASGDILIAETNPDNGATRRVVKITKENLLQGITGGGSSFSFTGELISMSGCTLYASGDQVGINTCDPASGYSLHVSGASLLSGDVSESSTLVVTGPPDGTGAVLRANHITRTALHVDQGISRFDGLSYFGNDPTKTYAVLFGPNGQDSQTTINSGIKVGKFSTAERDSLSADEGAILYNSTTDQFNFYQAGEWVTLSGEGGGGGSSSFTGSVIDMTGCTLYASGGQVGINTCDPASGYSLHVSGRTVLSGDAHVGETEDMPPTLTVVGATGDGVNWPASALVVSGANDATGVEIHSYGDGNYALYVNNGTQLGGITEFGDFAGLGTWGALFGHEDDATRTIITSGITVGSFSTVERDALSLFEGAILYNSTTDQFNFYQAGEWVTLSGEGGGGGSSSFTGSVIDMTGCTLYASGDQVGINICDPADGYSLHVSGATAASGNLDVLGNLFAHGTYISGNYLLGGAGQIFADLRVDGKILAGDDVEIGDPDNYPSTDGSLEVYGRHGITVGPWDGDAARGSVKIQSGVYLPVFSTAERDNLATANNFASPKRSSSGVLIFNHEEAQFQGYNGTEWVNLGSGGGASGITGASNIGAGSGVLSGISGNDLVFRTIEAGPNISINTGADGSLSISASTTNVTVTGGSVSGGIGSNPYVTGKSNFYTELPDEIIIDRTYGDQIYRFGLNAVSTSFTQIYYYNSETARYYRVTNNAEGTYEGFFPSNDKGFSPTISLSGMIESGRAVYLGGGGSGSSSSTTGITGASNIGAGDGLVSGVLNDDLKVKSLIGGTNVTLSASDNSITINAAGGGGGGAGSSFAFFSNAINNNGIIEKTYYPTVDPNIYLSGIDVDNASDITLYLRWDGPGDAYMGTGYINGQAIPTGNITQLGTSTRRFEGFISGLDLAGTTVVTGIANGSTGTISLQEAGAGPTPLSVFMPPVSSGTPKAGTNLGSSDYKGGDTTTGYVTFDTTDVTGIKVFDHGVSDFIDFTSYTLVDTGDARHTARIPLTINNTRDGSQTLKVIAVNNFGTTGAATESNAVTLDQTYPSVSASDPASSAYANNQGLTSGESVDFVNTIANWDSANGDTVLYSGLNNEITITSSGTFENPKTVTYFTGVYNNSDNITITAARDDNGAVDSTDVKIRIAKTPIITGVVLSGLATAATAPNTIGTSEVKGGDSIDYADVYVNLNEANATDIDIFIYDSGVADGESWTFYEPYDVMPDGSIKYPVMVDVTSSTSVSRQGAQGVSVKCRNSDAGNIYSPDAQSSASAVVNNTGFPSLTVGPVSYPANQSALKGAESATVTNTASSFDSIAYTSPGSELTISNPTLFEGSKNVTRNGGTYNISTDNFTATATKASNGMVRDVSTVVNIADTAAAFTINNLASSIKINTGESVTDNFDLDIDQILYENPALYLDYTQVPQSTLTATAQGTGTTDNNYRITVAPDDGKGEFTFSGSGLNLAGRETFVIGTNPNYTISGIVEGQGYISDQSPCAGLIYLGGPMINPSTISMENVSEGGSGPNDGTVYTYQSYVNGTSVDCTTDVDNKFAIVTSGAGGGIGTLLANTTGDHLFNLDQTNRQANTSSPGALIVISQT
tara:strand:+ start:16511 stop:21328 length:4818 start_codon:yes stop_codon:yes gene_type:complete